MPLLCTTPWRQSLMVALLPAAEALAHVRAGAGTVGALVLQAGVEEVLLALGEEHLVGPAGEPRVGGDGAGRLRHGGVELVVGHAAHGQTDGGRFGTGDDAAGVHHLSRPPDPDAPRQPLAHAPRRAHGPLAVGVGEAG